MLGGWRSGSGATARLKSAVRTRWDLLLQVLEVGQEVLAQADDDTVDVPAKGERLRLVGCCVEALLHADRRACLDQIAELCQQLVSPAGPGGCAAPEREEF